MGRKESFTEEISKVLDTKWEERNGSVIPASSDLSFKDAVKIDATFLYADLAGSSKLAKYCPWETTAKIIRAYLDCCTRVIKAYGGEIRSFDGDRVMGIFKSDTKNTTATKCAREIDWFVEYVIKPKSKEKFQSIRNNDINITHCIGIDTGEAVAVRAGVRNNNDLIWIGRAPSLAAKLSDIREYPFCVYISKACYNALSDSAKLSNGANIWVSRTYGYAGSEETIYRTKYPLTP